MYNTLNTVGLFSLHNEETRLLMIVKRRSTLNTGEVEVLVALGVLEVQGEEEGLWGVGVSSHGEEVVVLQGPWGEGEAHLVLEVEVALA